MLTTRDIEILETEERFPRRTGLKADHIIHTLGLSPTIYYRELLALVQRPEVVERNPQLAARVLRLRTRRSEERAALLRLVS